MLKGNTAQDWVYPRTHGETSVCNNPRPVVPGLSPYTRGNLKRIDSRGFSPRSIPVHTGKPSWRNSMPSQNGVYPRTHGETILQGCIDAGRWGLSPYTRGNLATSRLRQRLSGSIPVHTGKPSHAVNTCSMSWVYPRTHGETWRSIRLILIIRGLSPYTRGNPLHHWYDCHCIGSIPVHTGKPNATT